jgi:hypothetical protein
MIMAALRPAEPSVRPRFRERSEQPSWHALPADEVLLHLSSDQGGLAADEARRRLERDGPNRLPVAEGRGPLRRFLAQFDNLLIYVLIAAAAVTAALGHWIDTGVILAVVLVNAVLGFLQEGKAERALEAIREMLSPEAMIIRDRRGRMVPAEELVRGDVVFLQSGDKVPADLVRACSATRRRCAGQTAMGVGWSMATRWRARWWRSGSKPAWSRTWSANDIPERTSSRSNLSTASWPPCTTPRGPGVHLRQGRAGARAGDVRP